ncbi:ROK family transcriptional regulator [Hyphomonas sp.]|uniref:ROK family transcriptional regulator n=1 Tax=Hyphomonas sp. TaxID=87 RepID=UPI0030F6F32C
MIPRDFLRKLTDQVASPNERRVLDWIRRNPGETRSRIMHELDLSAQSVSRLTETLEQRGLVSFGDRVISGRGQPSVALSLTPSAAYAIGLSIMTDALSVVVMDFQGVAVFSERLILRTVTRESVIAACRKLLARAIESGAVPPERIFAFGIAFSGFFVGKGRLMNPVPALEDFALVDLEKLFSDAFQLPVWVDNDGNAAAVGESLVGVGAWANTFAYLYFTTGFGGGLVVDGRPFRGEFGNAGEFGAILPPEKHDERPTLELLRTMISDRGGPQFESLSEMLDAFDPDWPGVDAWIVHVVPQLSLVCSAICAVADPGAIVFGGSMPPALAERLIPHIRLNNFVRRGLGRPEPKLVARTTSGDATAMGAAAIAFKDTFFL